MGPTWPAGREGGRWGAGVIRRGGGDQRPPPRLSKAVMRGRGGQGSANARGGWPGEGCPFPPPRLQGKGRWKGKEGGILAHPSAWCASMEGALHTTKASSSYPGLVWSRVGVKVACSSTPELGNQCKKAGGGWICSVWDVAYKPDGSELLVAADARVLVYEGNEGHLLTSLKGPPLLPQGGKGGHLNRREATQPAPAPESAKPKASQPAPARVACHFQLRKPGGRQRQSQKRPQPGDGDFATASLDGGDETNLKRAPGRIRLG